MTGAGVVVVALGVGVGAGADEGLDTGAEDALTVGVAEDSTLGARFGVAVGDGRDDADGLEPGDDAEPVGVLAGHAEAAVPAASVSVPDAAQPSSVTCRLDTTSAFSSAGIHALSMEAARGA